MIKTMLIAAGLTLAALPSLACESHAEHATLAEAAPAPPVIVEAEVVPMAPASEAVAAPAELGATSPVETRAMQSVPFEPKSSPNNNPYAVNCQRGKAQTVYYTN
jgi:hypothetical protein